MTDTTFRLVFLALLAISLPRLADVQAQPITFGDSQARVSGCVVGYAHLIAVGRLDGDEIDDIAFYCRSSKGAANSQRLNVAMGTSTGEFGSAVEVYPAGAEDIGTAGGSPAIGDVDGDGKNDIVLAAAVGIVFLQGKQDGTFEAPVVSGIPFANYQNTFEVNLADFNGDEILDLVVCAAAPTHGVRVFLGNGDGTYGDGSGGSGPVFYRAVSGHTAVGVIPADFTGDGQLDMAIYGSLFGASGPELVVWEGLGTGLFAETPWYTESTLTYAWTGGESLDAGDVDGDYDLDIVMGLQGGVFLFRNNGEGFDAPVDTGLSIEGATRYTKALLIDFSGDGRLDLVASRGRRDSSEDRAVMASMVGDGAGGFSDLSEHGPNGYAFDLDFGQFDDTPGLDLVATVHGSPRPYQGEIVSFSGTGVRPELIGTSVEVAPGRLLFAPGEASRSVVVTNIHAEATLAITGITVDGTSSHPGDFSVGPQTCTAEPLDIGGGTCSIEIHFAPTDAGPRTTKILIAVSDPRSPTSFTVEGPGSADFGDAPAPRYDDVTKFPDGARHVAVGAKLGTYRDAETDASNDNASALGDDITGGPDDEDGVTFGATTVVAPPMMASKASAPPGAFGLLVPGSTSSVTVTASAPGFLNVFLDGAVGPANGDFADFGEHLVSNLAVSAGANSVSLAIPVGAGVGDGVLRFRLTDAEASTSNGVNREPSGEVEDYLVVISARAGVTLQPSGGGTVGLDGSGNVVVTDAQGSVTLVTPVGSVSSLVLTGTDGADSFTLDWGLVTAIGSITINLGDGFDTLVINQGTGTPSTIAFNHTNATDGSVTDEFGNGIAFTGLDPIIDHTIAATKVFNFGGGAETIELNATGDGAGGNGYSWIDSDKAEAVSFKNPTDRLIIEGQSGIDVITIGALDTPLAGTFAEVIVTGYDTYDGAGALVFTADDASADRFTVTPSSYPISVDGGLPAGTCPGDALSLAGSATVATFTNAAGTGSYTFSTGEAQVSFTSIESIGDGDIDVSANYSILYATDDLGTGSELVITATNNGPSDVNCISVTVDAALATWLDGAVDVASAGSFTDPTWSIPTLAAGANATLTLTGFVAPNAPQDVTFTSSATQDTHTSNNVATIELSPGFVFPARAQVNAALYYNKSTSVGSYEALVVGLYQGSAGITGSVWCKIPDDTLGALWPAGPAAAIGNHWRPCSTGLPFPLHVNDLFKDSNDVLWLATWGSAGLYRSDNGGETWTAAEPVLGPKGGFAIVYTIVEDAAGGILYISANNGLVFRSLDDGANWQQVASLPGVASDTPWSMATHPTISGTVYAGTFGKGVYYTDDFGFTWQMLDDPGTLANENDALLNLDNTGDDFAGHVFDLEFSPDAGGAGERYLFAGTGKGAWRAKLAAGTASDFNGTDWTKIGPAVTLDDTSVATPEVRTLAFTPDGLGDDALVAGSWGFGAFIWDTPNTANTFAELALRKSNVTFVAASPAGLVFLGASTGETVFVAASAATSTAGERAATMELPDGFALGQNYPNPFNPVTTIRFQLPVSAWVSLAVYDATGREVARLVDGVLGAGVHEATLNAADLPSGMFLSRLVTPVGTFSKSMILMK